MSIKHNGRAVLFAHQVIPDSPRGWGEREKAFVHEYQHCRCALEDALRKNADLERWISQLKAENRFLLDILEAPEE